MGLAKKPKSKKVAFLISESSAFRLHKVVEK
jgi:hypothetical protein